MTAVVGVAAGRRIRAFSVAVWIVGMAVVAAVGVATALWQAGANDRWFAQFPWYHDSPTDAVVAPDGVTWSAEGGARVPLADEMLSAGPLLLTYAGSPDSWITPAITPADASTSGETRPLDLVDATMPSTVLVVEPGATVWIDADGPWSATIEPLPHRLLTDGAALDGGGTEYLVYRGDAHGATVTHRADASSVTATVYDGGSPVLAFIEGGVFDEHVSWNSDGDVVLLLEGDPAARWSVVVDPVSP